MSTRTTILLFIVVATLVAAILGFERYLPSAQDLRAIKRGPSRLERDKITEIHITDVNGGVLSLSRKDSLWRVGQLGEDLADPEKVAALILGLDGVEWMERIRREEFDDKEWAKTSLDKPRHKVQLMKGTELVQECWFGAPAVMENSFYIGYPPRLGQEGETVWYVARTAAPAVLQMPQQSWRDGKLLRLPAELITGITLTQASGQIELLREDEHMPWVLMKPLKTRGSKDRINEILSILLNVEIIESKDAADTVASGAAAQSVTVAADEIKAKIEVKSRKQVFEITFKKPLNEKQTSTTATTGYRRPVFTVAARNLASLWVEPNLLRDHKLAQVNGEELSEINITSASFPEVKLRNNGGSWFLERHGKWETANGERLTRMLEALNSHEIIDFSADTAADLATFGLDKPFQTVSWQYPRFKPFKLLFGSNAESTKFYAKYDDEPFVYRINPSLLPALPPDSIKWKGLGALRFTTFALRRITMSMGAAAPWILNYNPATAEWTGSRAGQDITPQLDRVKADRIAGLLSKFSVQDWSASRSDAVQALKTPLLRIQVVLGEPGKNDGPLHEINLIFSNTQPNVDSTFLLYGQVEGDPDVFYITRHSLLEVVSPPVKDKAGMK